MTEYRMAKRVEEQHLALMSGFNELIPQELLNVFDERELELLIGGVSEVDMDDWKKHTDYVRPFFLPVSCAPDTWRLTRPFLRLLCSLARLQSFR